VTGRYTIKGGLAAVCIGLSVLILTATCAEEEGVESQVESQIASLQDEDPDVREHAASVLGDIGDPRAVEPLIAALNDEVSLVREWAAEALGKIGDARAVEPLIAVLTDESQFVRAEAAEALGAIGDARAVEPLIVALQDEDFLVRGSAAEALGKIGDARAVEPLIVALEDRMSFVYERAAKALGALEALGAVEPLLAAFRNRDLGTVAEKYAFFVARGVPGTEDVLIEVLNTYGTEAMAEVFLNCGNTQLEDAAREWAKIRGYEVGPATGGPGPTWASGR
jgi:HEAT repeat protein